MLKRYLHVKIKTGFRVSPPSQWKKFLWYHKEYNIQAENNLELNPIEYNKKYFLITCIHKAVNTVNYRPDIPGSDHWKIFGSLADRGDCEDYVLTKLHLLNLAGIPLGTLSPIICKNTRGASHMVLSIQTTRVTYILDNIIGDIRMISEIPYKYLYMLKGSRWYQVIGN